MLYEEDYKLALEAFKKVFNALTHYGAKQAFRSRARDLVEEIYNSGFIPTFFYIISKAELNSDSLDSLISLFSSDNAILRGSDENVSYSAYLFIILYYLIKRGIIEQKFLIQALRCEKTRLDLIDKLYNLAPIISAKIRTYLLAIKRLSEALIEAR
ncbi:type III-B CRISPR module-associated protein Cmr5 [Saccharolobus islandicus]|uniref:CRISPR type III-B/RAMP module-associated protein Cmr5 n=2 Tax=Saccharolobus islandicus TaxID=43080 RepID=F0NDX5_SACI5|nr:type III-B CRISPR module-associated protein Cmr5 [Sulfolobus islandicus]6S6B_A Chain A, CRISPR-associated protein, Cmr5 family [Sulfolobus islandicus REY15A]6S6B_B Chain B, CRISPR-associated protein, Cmr5 family [Sulfolobus islandicus REY15A]6S6B_C Chain C, CRISPR-associated protein, Cmr5 family [Sulfolobus islandicus REY15A]6S8B_A Chain A, CRISPR-associated protein, Cmr5 family [Sulfolobus islandicus REY15A]6S8B_B Chain B, CRISPR-associated protein, Cmr5 family [Sulfolobus islandicus REY15